MTEPKVINVLRSRSQTRPYIEVATTNRNKLEEFRRILPDYEIVGKKLEIEEIQSLDPYKVVRHKAIEAFKANDHNPILVEETSLELHGLGGRPGTYIKDFCEEAEMRRMIAERWLSGRDRRALARVLIAFYDGGEVQIREGITAGTIAESLRGMNGFGWDDMFIPEGHARTFAEMSDGLKDDHNMRRKALEALRDDPFELGHAVYMIPEPYRQEVERVNYDALADERALSFAYALEAIEQDNPPNMSFEAPNYQSIQYEENIYYTRYLPKTGSSSIGLILTDVDRGTLHMNKNGTPFIWQFGPERRTLCLAQRADFFCSNQNNQVLRSLDEIENGSAIPKRSNRRSQTVEGVLGMNDNLFSTSTYSWKDLGYRKMSSDRYVSRTDSAEYGLFNRIGKYPRSILGFGSMPAISGWRDVLVTAAIGHHPIFTHRNSIFAGYIDRQAAVIRAAKDVLAKIGLSAPEYQRAARNIGAALGCSNVEEEVAAARLSLRRSGCASLPHLYHQFRPARDRNRRGHPRRIRRRDRAFRRPGQRQGAMPQADRARDPRRRSLFRARRRTAMYLGHQRHGGDHAGRGLQHHHRSTLQSCDHRRGRRHRQFNGASAAARRRFDFIQPAIGALCHRAGRYLLRA